MAMNWFVATQISRTNRHRLTDSPKWKFVKTSAIRHLLCATETVMAARCATLKSPSTKTATSSGRAQMRRTHPKPPFLSPPVRPNSLGIIVDRCLRPLRAAMATSPHLSRWNANLSFSVQRCAVRWATATINSGRQCPSMVLCTLSCTIHRAMLHTPRLRLGHTSSSPLTSLKRVRWAHRVTGSLGTGTTSNSR